jgi:hypothetical protein
MSERAPLSERMPSSAAPLSQRSRRPIPAGTYNRWERPYLNFPQARLLARSGGAPRLRRPSR